MIVCQTKSKPTVSQGIDDHYISHSYISFNHVSLSSHHYFFIALLKILLYCMTAGVLVACVIMEAPIPALMDTIQVCSLYLNYVQSFLMMTSF